MADQRVCKTIYVGKRTIKKLFGFPQEPLRTPDKQSFVTEKLLQTQREEQSKFKPEWRIMLSLSNSKHTPYAVLVVLK